MSKRMSYAERVEQIRPYVEQGMEAREISEHVEIGYNRLTKILADARASGDLPGGRPRVRKYLQDATLGRIGQAIADQPDEVKQWVEENLPEGCTVAEFAVACMVDQYFDEVGA